MNYFKLKVFEKFETKIYCLILGLLHEVHFSILDIIGATANFEICVGKKQIFLPWHATVLPDLFSSLSPV